MFERNVTQCSVLWQTIVSRDPAVICCVNKDTNYDSDWKRCHLLQQHLGVSTFDVSLTQQADRKPPPAGKFAAKMTSQHRHSVSRVSRGDRKHSTILFTRSRGAVLAPAGSWSAIRSVSSWSAGWSASWLAVSVSSS